MDWPQACEEAPLNFSWTIGNETWQGIPAERELRPKLGFVDDGTGKTQGVAEQDGTVDEERCTTDRHSGVPQFCAPAPARVAKAVLSTRHKGEWTDVQVQAISCSSNSTSYSQD